jgi:hypothetical protein
MRARSSFLTLTIALSISLAASAGAQGKSQGHGPKKVPPGQAKKAVTVHDGVSSARVVLEEQGYKVWRVEPMGTSQVVYYYRGNNGRGRGHGPLEKIYIRPAKERQPLVVEGPTRSLVVAIQARLGF